MQRDNHEIIYGRREVFSTYKWEAIQQRTPKVLILGSSRVMAFRSQFFHLNEDAIYNGGMELTNIRRVKWMLDELAQQSKLPEIIILGLDQDWFLPERASSTKIGRIQISAPMSQPPDLPTILNRVRAVIANIIENRYAIADILDRRDPFYQAYTIGFNGIVSSNGFRWDGSRIVNPLRLHTLSDEQRFSNVYRLISANAERFRRSSAYDMEALDVLQDIIKFCNEHNIALITFSPPYAPSVYQQLIADGGYNYIPRLTNRLDEIMNEANVFYFDFTNSNIPNISNQHFLDGNHGSEFVYLNLYLEMLNETNHILAKYSSSDYLRQFAFVPSEHSKFDVFGVNQ